MVTVGDMAILEVRNLTKTYGKADTMVTALDSVSFNVEKGEFVAVVGASGSGKSTLMHCVGGVDKPTSGRIRVDGNDISMLDESEMAIFRRRNLGIVYQFYNLVPTLTAEENIMLPYLLDKRKPDEKKLRLILDMIDLTSRANYYPNQLSGGQQQRVSIGRALINDPAIIFADEPTGNLDSASSRDIIDLLKLTNRYGQTLIVITHDEKIALQADRILTIGDGRILSDQAVR